VTFEEIAKTFSRKELPDSEVELVGEIPFDDIAKLEAHALEHFQKELELPGFRPGHVPLDMVKKKVGDIALMEEQVEHFMQDFYPALLAAHDIDAVGRPSISITKLAPGNPVGITIKTAVYPTIALPKTWKELGKGVEIETVPDIIDAEVDEALEQIRKAKTESDSAAPVLDDAFAQSLGNFKDLAELKVKLRENMKAEKGQKAKEKRRGAIIDKLLKQADVAVPAIFVESELDKILGQMKEDVARFGMSYEEYLKNMKKTEDDLRKEFRAQATSRAKLQLLLNKIAEEEKIETDKDAVEHEMQHALQHFPDARPDLLQIHIETVLRNEKVLQLLEGSN
jgi:FKBP-type peptidyl-prolyl cis-trans isomerase (trigger factor)